MKSLKIVLVIVGTAWSVVVATYAAQVTNESRHGQPNKIINLSEGGASCSSSSSSGGA